MYQTVILHEFKLIRRKPLLITINLMVHALRVTEELDYFKTLTLVIWALDVRQ